MTHNFQRAAPSNLNLPCVIECAANRVHPERKLTCRRESIYEPSNVDRHNSRWNLCRGAMYFAVTTKSVRPECGRASNPPDLQHVPPRDPSERFEFRGSKGPAGGEFHRKRSDWTVAHPKAPNSDR